MAQYLVLDANGAAINRINYEPDSDWSPPEGCSLIPDDGRALAAPAAPTTIPASEFLRRFTSAELVSIAAAMPRQPMLTVGMAMLTAASMIDLTDPQVAAFLGIAVQEGALTAERALAIRTP